MNADEFVNEVRTIAELEDGSGARRAISATLSTLRERLAGNEPNNLADQLPEELAEALRGTGGQDNFSLNEFYDRVAEKEGVGREEAVTHARAVGTTLQQAVTAGEMDKVRWQLKDEYVEIFGRASS